MVSKVELYREVLEIEPNSKVFFPLARQLAGEGRVDEAVAVLTRGIGFHPDHLEAKFLLIELLTRQGRAGEADAAFADVGALLSRYPSVWLLWSKTAAARSKDPSLAMLFLANYFQNQSLTWTEVMERGLKSLSEAAPEAAPEAAAPAAEAVAAPAPPTEAAPEVPAAPPADPSPGREAGAPPLRGADEVMELADLLEAPDGGGEAGQKGRARPARSKEPVVRTRTMASLLAGQGDVAGALEIYNELLEAAAPGPERDELLALMAALAPPKSGMPAPETPETPGALQAPAEAGPAVGPEAAPHRKGSAKLINMLEALADRLEARAGA